MNQITQRLLNTISVSTSPIHCVQEAKRQLLDAGFTELRMAESFELEKGKGYVMELYNSSLLAFRANKQFTPGEGFRFAYAHTDFPGFSLKARPEIVEGVYRKLNVEVYGSPILNSWMDRPLSISGKVAVRTKDLFHPEIRLVDFKRPLLTIPNLAIHLDREVNKGKELNSQIDMLPLLGMAGERIKQEEFIEVLAKEIHVSAKDILDFELGVYVCEEGVELGMKKEFISAPRIDNLSSVQGCLTGIITGERSHGIDVIACFDHEEVGSRSKKGADSNLLGLLLEKIYCSLGGTTASYYDALLKSHCLSVDVAHAIHPNKKEKSDVTNKVYLNKGIAIKITNSQAYASDCEMVGILVQICDKCGLPYQKYYNRSDIKGGSTLGSIINGILPLQTQDIGIPILAMHSARETMGAKDQVDLEKLLVAFFSL